MSNPTIYPGATVCEGVTFGSDCVVGTHAYVGKFSRLGDQVRIQHGAFIPNRTHIGDRVFIGPNVTMTDDRYPKVGNQAIYGEVWRQGHEGFYQAQPPVLEDDCSIGAGAVLLPGVRIGHHAMVGAGAVVTDDVAPHAVVVGCPAREMNTV